MLPPTTAKPTPDCPLCAPKPCIGGAHRNAMIEDGVIGNMSEPLPVQDEGEGTFRPPYWNCPNDETHLLEFFPRWQSREVRCKKCLIPAQFTSTRVSAPPRQPESPRQDEVQNMRYAKQIAEYIREKYFPDVPQWKPLTGDLFGLLMQIDNMLTGLELTRSVAAPIEEGGDNLYFIQDTRNYVGNSVMWWRPNGDGYTSDIDQAWRVTKEKADQMYRYRNTDVAWPCAAIEAKAQRNFDMQRLPDIRREAKNE